MATTFIVLFTSLLSLLLGRDEAEIVFAGDAMMHQAQLDAASCRTDSYDFSECFTEITPWIKSADYAVVNLETPLGNTGRYTGYPCFYAPEAYARALADSGFDMMLTANNHTLDRSSRGLRSTIDILDRLNIDHIGTYTCDSARAAALPMIRRINNIRIAFLNYTYGTNGISPRPPVRVDYINRDLISSDIAAAHNAKADIICVCLHWGDEYQLHENAAQRSLTDFLIDEGVDLIIGSHPHVVQPIELRHSDRYDKDVLVVYSLGNFISNMRTRDTRGGAMVRVRLTRDDEGDVRITDTQATLLFTLPADNRHNFRLTQAERCDHPHWAAHARNFVAAAKPLIKIPVATLY